MLQGTYTNGSRLFAWASLLIVFSIGMHEGVFVTWCNSFMGGPSGFKHGIVESMLAKPNDCMSSRRTLQVAFLRFVLWFEFAKQNLFGYHLLRRQWGWSTGTLNWFYQHVISFLLPIVASWGWECFEMHVLSPCGWKRLCLHFCFERHVHTNVSIQRLISIGRQSFDS